MRNADLPVCKGVMGVWGLTDQFAYSVGVYSGWWEDRCTDSDKGRVRSPHTVRRFR
jgi:hypothetical protein